MSSKSLMVATASLFCLAIAGCVTPAAVETVPLKPASFDFTPPSTRAAGSAGMKIIIVSPSYAEDFAYSGLEPYESFGRSMANDFEEVLAARGYTVVGPYSSYDEIIFSEKESAELILLTDIEITQTNSLDGRQHVSFADMMNKSAVPKYIFSGSIGLTGKITLKAREPQSGEQMWVKSLEIQPQQYSVTTQEAWPQSALGTGGLYSDAGVFNPSVDALQIVYADAMNKAFTYLDPRELRTLLPQIERIKKNVRH